MASTQPNLNEALDSLPLGPVVEFVDRGAAYSSLEPARAAVCCGCQFFNFLVRRCVGAEM